MENNIAKRDSGHMAKVSRSEGADQGALSRDTRIESAEVALQLTALWQLSCQPRSPLLVLNLDHEVNILRRARISSRRT